MILGAERWHTAIACICRQSVGGSFGAALFGAVLACRLGVPLAEAAVSAPRGSLPAEGLDAVGDGVTPIQSLFLVALPIVAAALVVGLLL